MTAPEHARRFFLHVTEPEYRLLAGYAIVPHGAFSVNYEWSGDGWHLMGGDLPDDDRADRALLEYDERTFAELYPRVVEALPLLAAVPVVPAAPEAEHVWTVEEFQNAVLAMTYEEGVTMDRDEAVAQAIRAEAISRMAHRKQTDKLGDPYIEHPRRIAATFDPVTQPVEHCAAWLHDVLEDTSLSRKDLLAAGIAPEIVEVVRLLTRPRSKKKVARYYERIRQHPAARAVKLADIDDNTLEWRTARLDPESRERLAKKYHDARLSLGAEEDA
ncbi:hypothetical protein ACFFGH_28335 [Lysobacter korlensis]|uniref:Guanosine-3',5'-bis(Diphosphate) 3'-pyrophosphohydrolase n=1 Tax=Lysobacter korlensis TaxID=553636 RepID=A0ABV6S0T8_9GAMM